MRILGLDLGVGSIGWALIETDEDKNPLRILGLGSRIISLTPDESNNFDKGRGETICSQRTAMRTARKGNYRFKMRRALLNSLLASLGMKENGEGMEKLPPLQLWGLRADAATPGKRLSLTELGRVLCHINQKRGYRHSKSDSSDSKQTEYVQAVNARFREIKELHMTIGQFFHSKLQESASTQDEAGAAVSFRIKDNVFPRQAYEEEFDTIMETQREHYPEILTDDTIASLREAIFHQRPLKSCKHLVSLCEFEKHVFRNKDGVEVETGPKVAPRTSPLAQTARLYEAINNIRLVNPANRTRGRKTEPMLFESDSLPKEARLMQHEYPLTREEKQRIFEFLNTHEKMSAAELLRILGLRNSDGFKPDKAAAKGIKGNDTFVRLRDALDCVEGADDMLRFRIEIKDSGHVDPDTGEVIRIVSPDYIQQPLYRLWHLVYSISDRDELAKALKKQYGIEDPQVADRLFAIDFVAPGFSNRSAKFMRRIIPYLMEGYMYSEASTIAGVNHSDSITSAENAIRILKPRLELLPKNSLRQPVVEKILNQMINVVNALIDKFGPIDEARIELARSLKQSAKERAQASKDINDREKDNKRIADIITGYGLNPSRKNIQKYRMWEETGHTCMYCGQPVGAAEFLGSEGAEVEHIIPRSIFFDDSFSNKTCACRKCNKEKDNRTAYDFMSSRPEGEFEAYVTRVGKLLADKKISRTKYNRLLTEQSKIPEDFLNRDLRQSQYIAKKSREILLEAIRNVWATSGSVTDYFRHIWGYDRILHDSNLERYELVGMVKDQEYEHKGQIHSRRQIEGWSKRLDHRHHAVDALTIAQTRQSFVQRLSNLNREHGNLHDDIVKSGVEFKRQQSLLEQWADSRPHFPVAEVREAIDRVAVSFKAGKKLTTPGKRHILRQGKRTAVQTGLLVPRGSLHQESIYGRRLIPDGEKPLKFAFNNPDLICNHNVRAAVVERLDTAGHDVKKALKTLKKEPLTIERNGERIELDNVRCFRKEFVIKYPVGSIRLKDVDYIIDHAVRELIRGRFRECGDNDKAFAKSLEENPLRFNPSQAPLKSVRCCTGLKEESMVAPRKNGEGKTIGYAKGGNNHHVAFYQDSEGNIISMVTSFWTGVRRQLAGISAVVTDPEQVWDRLTQIDDEELREELSQTLPLPGWKFISSLQMNEMVILGLSEDEYRDAISSNDLATLTKHLYRVQKLSDNYYCFRYHTDTTTNDSKTELDMKTFVRAASNKAYIKLNPHKIRTTVLGEMLL